MSEAQKITNQYGDSLITAGKTINQINEMGKEKILLNIINHVKKSSSSLIKVLELEINEQFKA